MIDALTAGGIILLCFNPNLGVVVLNQRPKNAF